MFPSTAECVLGEDRFYILTPLDIILASVGDTVLLVWLASLIILSTFLLDNLRVDWYYGIFNKIKVLRYLCIPLTTSKEHVKSSTVQRHSTYSLGKALIFTADYSQHIRSCSLLTVTVVIVGMLFHLWM